MEEPRDDRIRVNCPYCAELIIKGARKCKHCEEFLDPVLRARHKAMLDNGAGGEGDRLKRIFELRRKATSECAGAVGATLILWILGVIFGPYFIYRFFKLKEQAKELAIPIPGTVKTVLVCGIIMILSNIAFGILMAVENKPNAVSHTYYAPPTARLVIDNGLDDHVSVLVDGKLLGKVAPGKHVSYYPLVGRRQIVIKDSKGTPISTIDEHLIVGGKYIVNPMSIWTYEICAERYSVDSMWSGDLPDPELIEGEEFVDVSKCDFILEEFPRVVDLPPGARIVTKLGIVHMDDYKPLKKHQKRYD